MTLIQVKNLIKTFKDGEEETQVLKGIDFSAEEGEWISVMGRSGAGKSTFMYQMSLLDNPTSGEIHLFGKDTHSMSASEKTEFRLTKLGYVFQDYALLPDLTSLENVATPLMMQGMYKSEAYAKAGKALEGVGLSHKFGNIPGQLSGGEQQRTSIARALAHKPKILFADEPTANLDNESSMTIMKLFQEVHKQGQTIIMVTHEDMFSDFSERIVTIDDGKIISDNPAPPQRHGTRKKK